jgi:hypothetical protein
VRALLRITYVRLRPALTAGLKIEPTPQTTTTRKDREPMRISNLLGATMIAGAIASGGAAANGTSASAATGTKSAGTTASPNTPPPR